MVLNIHNNKNRAHFFAMIKGDIFHIKILVITIDKIFKK